MAGVENLFDKINSEVQAPSVLTYTLGVCSNDK
jgi:hypothetical protein